MRRMGQLKTVWCHACAIELGTVDVGDNDDGDAGSPAYKKRFCDKCKADGLDK